MAIPSSIKWLVAIFLLISHKTIPFAYVIRFYYHVLTGLSSSKLNISKDAQKFNSFGYNQPSDLFKTIVLDSRVSPLEIDMYLHKSNSTYFLDLDIARTKLLIRIIQPYWWYAFANDHGQFGGGTKKKYSISNFPYVPVATVQCQFKKELKPFQKFKINSRILAWDKKWLFVLSVFTTYDKKTKKFDKINAIALTKYVFKIGKLTISPIDILNYCNFINDENLKINEKNYNLVKYLVDTEDLEKLASLSV
ncbi:uncharacterized protein KGF55_005598 [Candida pseudojiufengensis]|uniref:uncharacterized protein n=1 Tax=Candida pseudojiufengensis TaxID=497109 RepID=UPI002224E6D3|nr:uncharacterized protein KGF55_005598 [Candida pseudojiufengensis]KAI5958944.1 hypothetical protein KGF55_005598 [Candida pseudojiufengensis]